jgi:hypothetical protein
MELLIMKFSPLLCYLVRLRPKYAPQHPILIYPQPMFLPQYQRPSFIPIQKTGKIIILYILIFKVLDSKLFEFVYVTIIYCLLFITLQQGREVDQEIDGKMK